MRKEYDFKKGKRGAVIPHPGKTRITIWIDTDVLEWFRQKAEREGRGYQPAMNEALRNYAKQDKPIREVVREVVRDTVRKELRLVEKARRAG